MPKMYGWVREVVPESPADRAGLQPGDLLRTINGKLIRDLVDYRFYVADEDLLIGFDRQQTQHEVRITKTSDENLGVLFGEEPAPFIRQCANKCVFCFIKGLPERFAAQPGLEHGMRSSLYIKDDDYRYSFLFGNFITLTNLKEHDWQRLDEQKLTPLYVSVHCTDPDLRRKTGGWATRRRHSRSYSAAGQYAHYLPYTACAMPDHQRWRATGPQHR